MNDKNELKIKLKELEANIENNNVQKELESNEFNIDDLKQTIQLYYKNIEQINDEDLKNISAKVNDLVSHSNNSSFSMYSHQFINTARYLINNFPEIEPDIDANFSIQNDTQISEEEFSRRYDKLIEALNFEGEECNLILETPSKEKKPFKVFKNKNNSLAIYAKSSENPMTIASDRLLEVAFKRKKPTYKSYEPVIISKIIDNSIFDFLTNESLPKDLIEAMKTKLKTNEDELLKLSSKLLKIEKNNQELSTTKEQLSQFKQEADTVKKEFEDAKNAAIDHTKLEASVSYWETKQKIHRNKFWYFISVAIVLIFLLVVLLFKALSLHENQIDGNKSIIITKDINTTTTSQEKTDKNSELQEKSNFFDFDYSKLAWYILMIFASSSAFWIIRITVKIALSNLHLSEDAHERVVMIETYLSFVNEGKIDKDDKNLILSSLFRPSNIGIIKDESSVTVADIITAFKK